MDYKVILNLMKEMNHYGLTKLEIEEEGMKICLEKEIPVINTIQSPVTQPVYAAPAQASYAQGLTPYITASPAPAGQTKEPEPVQPAAAGDAVSAEELSGKKILSPMVGTFYMAAGPDKPPFVKVGDKVKKGQTICIIEAMKLMNEIEAEQEGEIVKVLIGNEQMVEYGQPMFLIK